MTQLKSFNRFSAKLLLSAAPAALAITASAVAAQVAPTNPHTGNVAIAASQSGGAGTPITTNATVTGTRGYTEWDTFDLGINDVFNVMHSSGSTNYIYVNRVTTGDVSQIAGTVNAGGHFWLINPNGIAVTGTGRFDVGGLLLSTATHLNTEDETTNGAEFLSPTLGAFFGNNFRLGGAAGLITIQPGAQLITDIGTISLISNAISFSGTANAGSGEIGVMGARDMLVGFDADMNAYTELRIIQGSNGGTAVSVSDGGGAVFNGARTVITAAGMSDGQGNILLNNGGGANSVTFQNGDVVLYAARNTSGGSRQIISGGNVQNIASSDPDEASVDILGGLSVPGNVQIRAAGGTGSGATDLIVSADGNLVLENEARGRDVALRAGGTVTTGAILARDDIVVRAAGVTSLGALTSSTTVDALGPTDVSGGADALAGAILNGGDIAIAAANGGSISLGGNLSAGGGGDVHLTAAGTLSSSSGQSIAGQDLFLTAQDFTGSIFDAATLQETQDLSITDTAGGLTVVGLSAAGNLSLTTVNSGGLIVQGATAGGNITLDSAADLALTGAVSAVGDTVTLNADGNITQAAAGIITAGTLTGNAGGYVMLIRDNQLSNLGSFSTNGGLFLNDLGGLTVAGSIDGGSGTANIATSGDLVIGATVTGASAGLTASGAGSDISIEAAVNVGGMTLTAGGNISQTAAGIITTGSLGGGSGGSTNLGTVTNNIGSLNEFSANGLLIDDVGGLNLHNTISGGVGGVDITTSGDIAIFNNNSSIVAINALISLTATGAGSDINLTAGTVNAGTGQVEVLAGGNIAQGSAEIVAGTLTGSASGNANFSASDNQIGTLGAFTSNGFGLFDNGGLVVGGTVNAGAGSATIHTVGGDLTINSSGGIAGSTVVLRTDQDFHNNSGSDAITASNRWLVYSAAPDGNTFGGLDSGNTAIWNGTYLSRLPGTISGTHYVFAYQPTLTFTSLDASKTYGTAITTSAYGVSGYHSGVVGAFLGDTAASAFSGAPTLSSAGYVANADVAGGPYAITIATGTVASSSGYALSFDSAGLLTVDPKAITGTVTATDRTYDGTTAATGSVSLSGILLGDDVTASALLAFADANAGNDKTVTIAGGSLSGTDAGNYTLSLPASTLADIFQKALTGTVIADDKTYDGTTDATGTVNLTGVIAGDEVTGSALLAFADANAGSDKTVTISGGSLSGAEAGNYTLSLPASTLADIFQKAITGTVVANDKTYDGTISATGSVSLSGVIAGDQVTASALLAFADQNAGSDKTVTISGGSLSGTDAGNYALSLPASTLADIFQKAITGSVVADDKTYDGTTDATGTVSLTGVIAGDEVTSSAILAFADANAGNGKAVTISGGSLSGEDSGNYTLTLPASTLADIFQKALTGTVVGNDKTYDGTTAATGSVTLAGVVAGDEVTATAMLAFADANAGSEKVVTISGGSLAGAGAGNYTLSLPASVLADIFQKAITGTVVADDKTYDGTTDATGTITLDGLIAGDEVTASAILAFADANAGNDKTVTISGGSLSGADAGNYTLSLPASTLADIFQKALTATVVANDKTYDGTTTATGTVALNGVVAGDDVTATALLAFADKNAGSNKTVLISGGSLAGADAGNYTLSLPASVLADILQLAITGTVVADDKTYDGTTTATGAVALTGVLAGDQVTASAILAFADSNAGSGKTVTISGASASGADAGNYSVTLPASTLADIFKAAITITANSLVKDQGAADPALTYAVTSGQVFGSDTLSGVLARTPGETPGDYAVLQGTLAASPNYELTFVPGVLTIEPKIVFNDDLRSLLGWEDPLGSDAETPLLIVDERDCGDKSKADAQCGAGGSH